MAILTRGKQNLKKKGITVAGDLTERQRQEIEEHRRQGLHAYYRGNRLVVDGPIRGRGNYNNNKEKNDNNRFESEYRNVKGNEPQPYGNDQQNGNNQRYWNHHQQYQPWSTSHFPLLPRRPQAPQGADLSNLHHITRQRDAERPTVTISSYPVDQQSAEVREKTTGDVSESDERPVQKQPSSPTYSQSQQVPSEPCVSPPSSLPTPVVSLCQQTVITPAAETTSLPHPTPTPGTVGVPPLTTAETFPLPHSPPTTSDSVGISSSITVETAPLPHSSPALTVSNETSTASLPHSPPLPVPAETTRGISMTVEVTTPSPHTPSTNLSSQSIQKNKSPPEKTARKLRNKSVSSTEGKRQLTLDETVSQSKGKKHEKAKSNDK